MEGDSTKLRNLQEGSKGEMMKYVLWYHRTNPLTHILPKDIRTSVQWKGFVLCHSDILFVIFNQAISGRHLQIHQTLSNVEKLSSFWLVFGIPVEDLQSRLAIFKKKRKPCKNIISNIFSLYCCQEYDM